MLLKSTLQNSIFLVLLAFFLFLSACKIDEDLAKPKFSPDFTLPLVYGDLKIDDLLNDTSYVKEDPNKAIKIVIRDTVSEQDLNQQVFFGNYDTLKPLMLSPSGADVSLNDQELEANVSLSAVLNQLKQMVVRTGTMTLRMRNMLSFDLSNVTVTIPGLTDAVGNTYTHTFSLINNSSEESIVLDLQGYTFDLSGKNNNQTNTIYIQVLSNNTGAAGGNVELGLTLSDIKPRKLKGKLFNLIDQTNVSSSIDVFRPGFYKHVKSGSIDLTDAKITADFISTSGVAYYLNVNASNTNAINGNVVNLPTQEFIVNPALEGPPPVSDPSNVREVVGANTFLSNFPGSMTFNVYIKDTVPVGVDPYTTFVYDDSKVKLFVNAEIPFSIRYNDLTLVDTLSFDFLSGDDGIDTTNTTLEQGSLGFTISNQFPYLVQMEFKALDSLNNVLAYITPASQPIMIDAASIDQNAGRVVNPKISTFNIPITKELFNQLQNTEYIEVRAVLNTPGTLNPQIYSDYKLGFRIRGQVKVFLDPLND